ncbi:unnamed protein product, partial [Amoebophrya sp. A25]
SNRGSRAGSKSNNAVDPSLKTKSPTTSIPMNADGASIISSSLSTANMMEQSGRKAPVTKMAPVVEQNEVQRAKAALIRQVRESVRTERVQYILHTAHRQSLQESYGEKEVAFDGSIE